MKRLSSFVLAIFAFYCFSSEAWLVATLHSFIFHVKSEMKLLKVKKMKTFFPNGYEISTENP